MLKGNFSVMLLLLPLLRVSTDPHSRTGRTKSFCLQASDDADSQPSSSSICQHPIAHRQLQDQAGMLQPTLLSCEAGSSSTQKAQTCTQ
jgi:hypothetical protein